MIDWRPIAEMPEKLKDGRRVLLWSAPADGQYTPGADVGTWSTDTHWSEDYPGAGGYWEALYECAKIDDVTHYAEITHPLSMLGSVYP